MTTISVPAANRSLITWSDELSVGIEEIDEQHKILVSLVNKLQTAITEHHGSEASESILDELVEYTRIHFAVEEALLRMLDYPQYESHKRHHKELLGQVIALRSKVDDGRHVSFELLHFLKNWLTHHIMEEDKEYAPFLLGKGVRARYEKRSWLERLFH